MFGGPHVGPKATCARVLYEHEFLVLVSHANIDLLNNFENSRDPQ